MGSGLAGGPLTGNVTTAALPPAPAGESAVLSSPLGAGATDVVTKIGSTEVDATVNAAAKLTSFRTGIGGTEVEKAYITKLGALVLSSSLTFSRDLLDSGASGFAPRLITSAGNGLGWNFDTATNFTVGYVARFATFGTVRASLSWAGQFDQSGTDSTGAPGAATIDKPTGKSAIAIGAASVTITCSLCAATSRVMITPHARDATCKELIVVPGAGSFVVSGSANTTAALPFSWEVSNIL